MLLRRTRLGLLDARALCARRTPRAPAAPPARVAGELGWDEARIEQELRDWAEVARLEGLVPGGGRERRRSHERPLLMGIVNATPDSFSDPQGEKSLDALVERAHELAEEGAAIVDVGGESGRTDRPAVPVEEEQRAGGAADRAAGGGRAARVGRHLARAGGARGAGGRARRWSTT